MTRALSKDLQRYKTTAEIMAKCGWLTLRQIARMNWPEEQFSLKIANEFVRLQLAKGLFVTKKTKEGEKAFMLSVAGAAAARNVGVEAESQEALTLGNAAHRILCNDLFIGLWSKYSWQFFSEHDFNKKDRTPFKKYKNKVPDSIAVLQGRCTWFEVENAAKPREQLEKVANCVLFLLEGGARLTDEITLDAVVYVFDAGNIAGQIRMLDAICNATKNLESLDREAIEPKIKFLVIQRRIDGVVLDIKPSCPFSRGDGTRQVA